MRLLSTTPRRQLVHILQTQLIPWAGGGAPIALLHVPPYILGQNAVTEMPCKALSLLRGFGQDIRVHKWHAENMNAVSTPMFGCVIEGEADLEVGTTQAICQKLKIKGKRWVVAAPKSTFFFIPPGTPVSSTGNVHWRRAHPEKAYSRMFWVQVHETGAYCHFNTSDKGKLWISPHLFCVIHKFFL